MATLVVNRGSSFLATTSRKVVLAKLLNDLFATNFLAIAKEIVGKMNSPRINRNQLILTLKNKNFNVLSSILGYSSDQLKQKFNNLNLLFTNLKNKYPSILSSVASKASNRQQRVFTNLNAIIVNKPNSNSNPNEINNSPCPWYQIFTYVITKIYIDWDGYAVDCNDCLQGLDIDDPESVVTYYGCLALALANNTITEGEYRCEDIIAFPLGEIVGSKTGNGNSNS
jgi:hypothetical protein